MILDARVPCKSLSFLDNPTDKFQMLDLTFRNKIRKALTVFASILIAASAASSVDLAKGQVTSTVNSTLTTLNSTLTSVTGAKPPRPPAAPETNTGVVLLPFFALFLLWSSLTFLRRRAAEME
jgi:hypothetical protein